MRVGFLQIVQKVFMEVVGQRKICLIQELGVYIGLMILVINILKIQRQVVLHIWIGRSYVIKNITKPGKLKPLLIVTFSFFILIYTPFKINPDLKNPDTFIIITLTKPWHHQIIYDMVWVCLTKQITYFTVITVILDNVTIPD